MKVKVILAILILFTFVLTGCGRKDNKENNNSTSPSPVQLEETGSTPAVTTPPNVSPTEGVTDAVTTASIVNNEAAFLNAISANGTWIICLLNDLKVNQDITLEGEFKNGKVDDAGKDIIQRKVALYTQDENRNITARFTLTAPKFTINSPEASIQRGTFVGDLYVNATNFKLVDAVIEGNIYFKDAQVQSTFSMDETSKVTGTQGLQQ